MEWAGAPGPEGRSQPCQVLDRRGRPAAFLERPVCGHGSCQVRRPDGTALGWVTTLPERTSPPRLCPFASGIPAPLSSAGSLSITRYLNWAPQGTPAPWNLTKSRSAMRGKEAPLPVTPFPNKAEERLSAWSRGSSIWAAEKDLSSSLRTRDRDMKMGREGQRPAKVASWPVAPRARGKQPL